MAKDYFRGLRASLIFCRKIIRTLSFRHRGRIRLLGCLFILFLYFVLIYRGLITAKECKDPFGMLLATGVVSMWAFQILVNVGMTCGIMPVTGIPLPFMSYGVSALTTNMMSMGILMSIYMRQQTLIF